MSTALLAEPAAGAAGREPMVPEVFTVARTRQELADVWTIELDIGRGFAFRPGQFNMLYAFGAGEVQISISGDVEQQGKLVHTIRNVGAVTNAICKIKRGDKLGVRGPFGSDWQVEESVGQDVVVIAGGIGLAPLRPVIYHLLSHRESYGRVALLYGARSPESLLYRGEVEKWRGHFDMEVEVTVDTASTGWRGNVGVVTRLIDNARFDPSHTTAMICGPEIMMRFTAEALIARGVAPAQVFVSMERNMQCGIGHCGHCQLGPTLICRDGPVYDWRWLAPWLAIREL